jgi:ATP-binding protein involved in chromosome partitioning
VESSSSFNAIVANDRRASRRYHRTVAASRTIAVSADLTEALLRALAGVVDPELGGDIVELGMVRGVVASERTATVTVALTIAGCPLRDQLRRDIEGALLATELVDAVVIEMSAMTAEERRALMDKARLLAQERAAPTAIPAGTRVLAIVSGKGGVGKSTVAVNLAVALAADGLTVGLLDADIWGFSVPRMIGVDATLEAVGGRIIPVDRPVGSGTVRVVSMGFLTNEDDAVMWRGLMLNRAVQHFLEDVAWGELDYLVVDMPPGTGDVQMGLARMLPRAELVVVTTPALAAQKVAGRAADMARRGHLRITGVIENMSSFTGSDGEVHTLFGVGGGARLAHEIGAPLIGSIPLDPAVASGGDSGEPLAMTRSTDTADVFIEIARRIRDELVADNELENCTARLEAAVGSFSPQPRP